MSAATGCSADEVRAFLDSRSGRHFADDAGSDTIDAAITKWMHWTVRRSERMNGIPAGLPYLTAQIIAAATQDA